MHRELYLVMGKKIKVILIGVVLLFGITVLGVWYLASSINPAQLTRLLASTVKGATGRDLKISGSVNLSVFPSLGIIARDVSLSNAQWAADTDMIRFKEIDLNVKLLPLFSKRVEISRIDLHGLEANLQTNRAGEGNWVMNASVIPTVDSKVGAGQESQELSGNDLIFAESINLTDGRIAYLDNHAGQDKKAAKKIYEIQNLSLLPGGETTTIHLALKQADADITLQGKVTALHKIASDWGRIPMDVAIDWDIGLNGKSINVAGKIHSVPKALPSFDLSLTSKEFDVFPLAAKLPVGVPKEKAPGKTASANPSEAVVPMPSPAKDAGDPRRVFSDNPLPLNLLPEVKGRMTFNIDQLNLPNRVPLKNVKADVDMDIKRIDINSIRFGLGNGSAQGSASLLNFKMPSPSLSVKGLAKGFTLEQLLATTVAKSKIVGGDAELAFNLKSVGNTLHQLVGHANGQMQISVGQARLATSFLNQGGDFLITLFDAVNPFRKKASETILECAVAYLPAKDGVLNIADSVGIQTDKLNVSLSGSINLDTEAVNLNIYPQEKSGLTTGLDLANLVKLQGTLTRPSIGINKAGVIDSAVSIGLGFLTGGTSLLAQNAVSVATKAQPCHTAMHAWSSIYPNP